MGDAATSFGDQGQGARSHRGTEIERIDPVTRKPVVITIERAIWELAGFVGVIPWRMTYREIDYLANGKQVHMWNHTSALITAIQQGQICKPQNNIVNHPHYRIVPGTFRSNKVPLTDENIAKFFGSKKPETLPKVKDN